MIGARDFFFLQNIQTEAHPASYVMGSQALSQAVKQLQCEIIHPPPSSAKVKNVWNYTFTPSICSHAIYRENINLLLVVRSLSKHKAYRNDKMTCQMVL